MSANSSNVMDLLSDSRIEAINGILSEDQDYISGIKNIDDRLNQLLKIVPKESRDMLYEIEMTIGMVTAISKELAYIQGVQDGMSLTKQATSQRKPSYFILEVESRRKAEGN